MLGQTRIDSLALRLDSLAMGMRGLDDELELTVSNLPLREFIRNIANATSLNISLEDNLTQTVTNNFTGVSAKDVLLFLCKYYELELEFTGNIIAIRKYSPPPVAYYPRKLKIGYDSITTNINLDLKRDSLRLVTMQITRITGRNVIHSPEVEDRIVSCYLQDLELTNALDKLALSNNLVLEKKDDIYIFKEDINASQQSGTGRKPQRPQANEGLLTFTAYDTEHIDVYAHDVPMEDVIEQISKDLNINYFILNEISGNTNLNMVNVTYDEMVESILNGSSYTFTRLNGIYVIGERVKEGLRETKVLQLQFRSIKDVVAVIPENLKTDVNIIEFAEQNSIILSGSSPGIKELENFITEIDKTIPLIIIEVMIINNQTGYTISTGISAGISEEPVASSGQLFPAIDFTLSSESINKLINSFNGFGATNLGRVNESFYISLKAMEEAGIIKVRSTPKLSTLNGHEASLVISNTEYYLEERSDFIVNQSTSQKTTHTYKSVTADFKLTILPIVAGDDHVTLDILVEQSDFTDRISKQAPPGQVTRSFTSLIRVRNDEMVLLGGLEEKSMKDTGSGIPILSRIPVLKWIFSSKTKEDKENKLNIFIKPTIIY